MALALPVLEPDPMVGDDEDTDFFSAEPDDEIPGESESAPDDGSQLVLLAVDEDWRAEWQGMPEYSHEDLAPTRQLIVNFATPEDVVLFVNHIGQKITARTQFIWYPQTERLSQRNRVYL